MKSYCIICAKPVAPIQNTCPACWRKIDIEMGKHPFRIGDKVRNKKHPVDGKLWTVTDMSENLFWTAERSQGMDIADFEFAELSSRDRTPE